MYVDKPLPEKDRLSLKNRADRVRDEIIKKSDEDLYNMLEERGITSVEDIKGSDSEWLRFEPQEEAEATETVPGDPIKELEVLQPNSRRRNSAKQMISSYDRSLKSKVPTVENVKPKREKKRKKEREAKVRKKKPSKPSREVKKKPTRRSDVDVITIEEQGVYTIDVKRLLEDNPIIIQKDGSYLIHLPSLFESKKKREKM